MGIRKKDLSEFIEAKARKRKSVLREAARVAVSAAFKPVIYEKFKEFDKIERTAQQLHDSLVEAYDQHTRLQHNWDFKNTVRSLNSTVIGYRDEQVRNATHLTLHNILDLGTNGMGKELEALMPSLKEQLAATITEYRTLCKLTDEVMTVISSCRNGDAAYKRLQEIGVDLSGFAAVTPNLPAVIKLSADVCVLNGDCK